MSSQTPRANNGIADNTDDEILLIHMGMGVLATLLASAGVLWLSGTQWLVEHHILLPAGQEPLVQIPGASGAGLDLARVTIGAAIILAALAAAASAARRAIVRRRQEEA